MALDTNWWGSEENGDPWLRNPEWKWIVEPEYLTLNATDKVTGWTSVPGSKTSITIGASESSVQSAVYDVTTAYKGIRSPTNHGFEIGFNSANLSNLTTKFTYLLAYNVYQCTTSTTGALWSLRIGFSPGQYHDYLVGGIFRFTNQTTAIYNASTSPAIPVTQNVSAQQNVLQIAGVSIDPRNNLTLFVGNGGIMAYKGTTRTYSTYSSDGVYPEKGTPTIATVGAMPYGSLQPWPSVRNAEQFPSNPGWGLQFSTAGARTQGNIIPVTSNTAAGVIWYEIRLYNRAMSEAELIMAYNDIKASVESRPSPTPELPVV